MIKSDKLVTIEINTMNYHTITYQRLHLKQLIYLKTINLPPPPHHPNYQPAPSHRLNSQPKYHITKPHHTPLKTNSTTKLPASHQFTSQSTSLPAATNAINESCEAPPLPQPDTKMTRSIQPRYDHPICIIA